MTAHAGALAIGTPRPDTYVIGVTGTLDRILGARLRRLVDARLLFVTTAGGPTRHILVDLAGVEEVTSGAEALEQARRAAEEHGVHLQIIGADPAPAGSAPAVLFPFGQPAPG
ncbi:hypothetical protein LWC33_17155 [Pseudonocardia sp. RS11V-5]|uniref:STAS domain-containing protein n=1 Tax=Pseudonocardia terrae TaxID=2905831 RepID=UPI001E541655|nr:hypothetical protein [Pseudonocardia terrae]MCE3553178.1 hypothetical protein [Pseudonocardia terrae]